MIEQEKYEKKVLIWNILDEDPTLNSSIIHKKFENIFSGSWDAITIGRYINEYHFAKDWFLDNKLKKGYDVLPENFYNSLEWAKTRIKILRRDNFRCKYCGKLANHVDHLNSAKYYPQIALDPNNLISSCESCHNKRHNKES